MEREGQLDLFTRAGPGGGVSLPTGYTPCPPVGVGVERIILARGSLATPEREAFVRRICAAYPGMPIEERLRTPHNRVEIGELDPVRRVLKGKRTLVFGELGLDSAVWTNCDPGGMYPYPRFFSVYGFCPYACTYCYLNATPIAFSAPAVRIYVNLAEILREIDRQAVAARRPLAFYLGKMQEALALDPLTAFSTVLVPFFAAHPYARLVMQTKSASVERLLALRHNGHTAVSWTVTPPEIAARYELNAPAPVARLDAMARCAAAGYIVCANVAPIMLDAGWEDLYLAIVREILATAPVRRIFFGGIYLKKLSLRHYRQHMGHECETVHRAEWRTVRGNNARSYRFGYADRFFARVQDLVRREHPCRFATDNLNGGSLVVQFEKDGAFGLFEEGNEETNNAPA